MPVSIYWWSHFPQSRRFSRVFEHLSRFSRPRRGRQLLVSINPLGLQRIVRSECISRPSNLFVIAVEDLGVGDRAADVPMPEGFLDSPEIMPRIQQIGGQRMPKGTEREDAATAAGRSQRSSTGFSHQIDALGAIVVRVVYPSAHRVGIHLLSGILPEEQE